MQKKVPKEKIGDKKMCEHNNILYEIKLGELTELEGKEFEILSSGKKAYRGSVIDITEKDIDDMVENFNNDVVGTQLAVDVNHDPNHKAFAWFAGLRRKGSKLMAKFKDFTGEGKKLISEKAFKYFSVEIDNAFERVFEGSKKTFKNVLRGVALTNRPVDKDIAPTFLSENLSTNIYNMKAFYKYAETLKEKEFVLAEEKEALNILFDELEGEEKEKAEEVKTEVEAKPEEATEAATEETTEEVVEEVAAEETAEEAKEEVAEEATTEEAETTEEAKEEEATEEVAAETEAPAEEVKEEATTEEAPAEVKEEATLSESKFTKLSENNKMLESEVDKLKTQIRFAQIEEKTANEIQLSEKNPIGLSAKDTEDLNKYLSTLSEKDITSVLGFIKKMRHVDFAEHGHSVEGVHDDNIEVTKLAETRVIEAKAQGKTLTLGQAMSDVIAENPAFEPKDD